MGKKNRIVTSQIQYFDFDSIVFYKNFVAKFHRRLGGRYIDRNVNVTLKKNDERNRKEVNKVGENIYKFIHMKRN